MAYLGAWHKTHLQSIVDSFDINYYVLQTLNSLNYITQSIHFSLPYNIKNLKLL